MFHILSHAKMKSFFLAGTLMLASSMLFPRESLGQATPLPVTNDLLIREARITHVAALDVLHFTMRVKGSAGATQPEPRGTMDGAPVLAYVFPTTLKPEDVGFRNATGVVALAITSHPDFDDTPLWDENGNANYDDDGLVFHTHWVVLGSDERVPGGLAVVEIKKEDAAKVLPPTAPGMPMYLDSPGFNVRLARNALHVVVPVPRVGGMKKFNFDAVSAYMEVNTSDSSRPLLGVYEVYSVLSGDLSLPYTVQKK